MRDEFMRDEFMTFAAPGMRFGRGVETFIEDV